jgi:hypothetical protein
MILKLVTGTHAGCLLPFKSVFALAGGTKCNSDWCCAAGARPHRSSKKTGLTVKLPTDLDGSAVDAKLTRYSVELKTKILSRGGSNYTYFDQARAIRE